MQIQSLIPFIPLLPAGGAIVNGLFGHRLPRLFVGLIACGTVFTSALIAFYAFAIMWGEPAGTEISTTLYTWINAGGLTVDVTFSIDRLSGLMVMVVTGVGFLIHLYSWGYMEHEPALARYYAYLNLFMFAMLVLVLGDSLPLMFVGWEGVGLCSYLLIGFWYTDTEKAKAGKKAFITNRIGDFGFLVAMLLLFRVTGTLTFDGLQQAVTAGQITTLVATGACLMLFLGATGKSAQLPLYVWLPDAMAGPTPVSALIHAATMVTAGVYMVCRMGFLFALSPIAMLTVALVGAATALFAATIGTVQNDIKKVLAYSTVSQLGFMFIAAGVGAYSVAMFHVITHAFFKACLFLGSGSVIHGMSGEQDMRQMGGLWRKQPITFATFLVATLAITGFPLLSGFISKDAILWSAWSSGMGTFGSTFGQLGVLLWFMGVFAAGLTSFYMWRLVFMTFFSGPLRAPEKIAKHVHESPWTMTLPLVVLAALSLVAGIMGWPHLFGGHDWISGWTAPAIGVGTGVVGEHIGLEWGLMTASTLVALSAFLVAYYLYARGLHPATHRLASQRPTQWLYARLLDKWHLDELYEVVVIRPIVWTSRVVLFEGLDKRIIDATVNLVGWFARTIGFVGQLFQSGNIQRYLAIFAIGLAILIYGWMTPLSFSTPPTPPAAAAVAAPKPIAQIPSKAPQVRPEVLTQLGGRR